MVGGTRVEEKSLQTECWAKADAPKGTGGDRAGRMDMTLDIRGAFLVGMKRAMCRLMRSI
jgi:hypothetical protein